MNPSTSDIVIEARRSVEPLADDALAWVCGKTVSHDPDRPSVAGAPGAIPTHGDVRELVTFLDAAVATPTAQPWLSAVSR